MTEVLQRVDIQSDEKKLEAPSSPSDSGFISSI